jgi:hypothetical protein
MSRLRIALRGLLVGGLLMFAGGCQTEPRAGAPEPSAGGPAGPGDVMARSDAQRATQMLEEDRAQRSDQRRPHQRPADRPVDQPRVSGRK